MLRKLLLFSLISCFSLSSLAEVKVLSYKSWRQGRILFEKAKLEQVRLQGPQDSLDTSKKVQNQSKKLSKSRGLDVVDYYEIYLSTRFSGNKKALHWALKQLTDSQKTALVLHLQNKTKSFAGQFE